MWKGKYSPNYILYGSFYILFLRWQNYRNEEHAGYTVGKWMLLLKVRTWTRFVVTGVFLSCAAAKLLLPLHKLLNITGKLVIMCELSMYNFPNINFYYKKLSRMLYLTSSKGFNTKLLTVKLRKITYFDQLS